MQNVLVHLLAAGRASDPLLFGHRSRSDLLEDGRRERGARPERRRVQLHDRLRLLDVQLSLSALHRQLDYSAGNQVNSYCFVGSQ